MNNTLTGLSLLTCIVTVTQEKQSYFLPQSSFVWSRIHSFIVLNALKKLIFNYSKPPRQWWDVSKRYVFYLKRVKQHLFISFKVLDSDISAVHKIRGVLHSRHRAILPFCPGLSPTIFVLFIGFVFVVVVAFFSFTVLKLENETLRSAKEKL